MNRDIYYVDGTDDSYKKTKVLLPEAQDKADKEAARVHTADDEPALWVNLLSILQRAEKASRKWDKDTRNKTPPKASLKKPVEAPEYGLVVGLQSKTRSWDFMPSSVTKVRLQVYK